MPNIAQKPKATIRSATTISSDQLKRKKVNNSSAAEAMRKFQSESCAAKAIGMIHSLVLFFVFYSVFKLREYNSTGWANFAVIIVMCVSKIGVVKI